LRSLKYFAWNRLPEGNGHTERSDAEALMARCPTLQSVCNLDDFWSLDYSGVDFRRVASGGDSPLAAAVATGRATVYPPACFRKSA
jgi:hypothetical protein